MAEPPIEEVLDELIPDWREIAGAMKQAGASDEEIVAAFRQRMHTEIDSLLDLYNSLGGTDQPPAVP